jgi:1-deoxy-D-xylulose-5-phosphate synthase
MAYLRCIPNLIIFAPLNEIELRNIMFTAQLGLGQPIAIRYPRGRGVILDWKQKFNKIPIGKSQELKKGTKIAVLSIGHIGNMVTDAIKDLHNSDQIGHYNMRFIKPLDTIALQKIFSTYKYVVTIEDGCKIGGFGSAILEYANEMHSFVPIRIFGIEDIFIEQGTIEELHEIAKIDISTLKNYINNLLNTDWHER